MTTHLVLPRLPASLFTSAAVHALGIALAVRFLGIALPAEMPQAVLIPVSLVSLPGGGGGAKGDGRPAPPPRVPPTAAVQPAAPLAPQPQAIKRIVKKVAPPLAAAPATPNGTAVEQGSGNTAATGSGRGDGTGGDGSGGARPAYGSNPRPPYPLAARRLGLEGRVLLEVVVTAEGRAGTVRVRQSSGHRVLDESAVETVRTRWRFVPARQAGQPVESTVAVPIRFRIHQG